jgi:hypothetical protein
VLLLSLGGEVFSKRGHCAAQVSLNGARRDLEHLGGAPGVEVYEQPQGNHLPLPGR